MNTCLFLIFIILFIWYVIRYYKYNKECEYAAILQHAAKRKLSLLNNHKND